MTLFKLLYQINHNMRKALKLVYIENYE